MYSRLSLEFNEIGCHPSLTHHSFCPAKQLIFPVFSTFLCVRVCRPARFLLQGAQVPQTKYTNTAKTL